MWAWSLLGIGTFVLAYAAFVLAPFSPPAGIAAPAYADRSGY